MATQNPHNNTVGVSTLTGSGTVTGLTAGAVTNATLTTALTVNTGTLTLTANAANTSVLTIGAGAVSVSGSNTGDQTTVSGNAGTATALQNARTIGGVSFDGTGNIVPQTIQSVNEATDTTCFPLFINDSGSVSDQPKNNTSLTFNSNTANLGSTIFNAGTGFQIGGAAASGKFLVGNGTNYVASTSTIPTSAGATANKLLLSDGTNYVLSTPTFPNASATSGKIIKSDGTNWVASIETYAVPGTSGNILTSDGTNWTSAVPVVTASSTNTFTNKTYDTAGTGNSFSINGVAATANTGTGAVARAAGPTFTLPALGVATATSVAIGGATIGTDGLGVTGTATISGALGVGASALSTFMLYVKNTSAGAIQRYLFANSGNTSGTISRIIVQVGGTSATAAEVVFDNSGTTAIFTGVIGSSGNYQINTATVGTGTASIEVKNDGSAVYFPVIGTTASAGNAFLNSGSTPANQILRSTSSIKYKTDIEDLEDQYAAKILNLRPVWYRSLCDADRKDWSYYGFIAEEVAKIDPHFVHYGYQEDAYQEEVENSIDDKGDPIELIHRSLKPDAVLVPDGVQYDRLIVPMLALVQKMEARINELEQKVGI